MGSLHCYLQRAHGVLVADCNICFTVQVLNSFDIFRIVNEEDFVVPFLHKRNACNMHHLGGGSNILQSLLFCRYSFRSSCMNCAVRVFRFHTLQLRKGEHSSVKKRGAF